MRALLRVVLPPSHPHLTPPLSPPLHCSNKRRITTYGMLHGLWPFTQRKTELPSLQRRLEDCESRQNKLESDQRAIALEWETVYQKMHNALSSMNMKQRKLESLTEAPLEPPKNGWASTAPSTGERLRAARQKFT